ncbi:MAG: hypothetical protein ABJN60_00915 [Parasphingorhabdus sp.]
MKSIRVVAMLDKRMQYNDLDQTPDRCLKTAESLSLTLVAIKICEAIELLDNNGLEQEDC